MTSTSPKDYTKGYETPTISIVLPCLNEEQALPYCIDTIEAVITRRNLNAEILIVDNGSTDKSVQIIQDRMKKNSNLHLLIENHRGYGSAYLKGLSSAKGTYICMADADATYDFNDIPLFVEKLQNGDDLVLGNRFIQSMKKGSMPWHHKYIGNPVLSFLVKIFFKVRINDVHCGMRAITRSAFQKIKLYTLGMEFASEMVIKAARNNLRISEISIKYSPRIGESKLKSFTDGWRHLRFILLYSPLLLFMLPGIFLCLIGAYTMYISYIHKSSLYISSLGIQYSIYSAFAMIIGYQLLFFAGFSKVYAITHLGDSDKRITTLFKYINIERASVAGLCIIILGIFVSASIMQSGDQIGTYSTLHIKRILVGLTLLALGIQTIFSSFMFSIVGIKEK